MTRGIIWPEPIAPFHVVLVPINLQKSARVREVADQLYAELTAAGIDVLSTTATPARASSSRTPSCSAFRTAWSSASAGWRRASSSTAAAATARVASSPGRGAGVHPRAPPGLTCCAAWARGSPRRSCA